MEVFQSRRVFSIATVQFSSLMSCHERIKKKFVKLIINAFFFFPLKHWNVLQKPQFCTARVSQASYQYGHSLCVTGNITHSKHLENEACLHKRQSLMKTELYLCWRLWIHQFAAIPDASHIQLRWLHHVQTSHNLYSSTPLQPDHKAFTINSSLDAD